VPSLNLAMASACGSKVSVVRNFSTGFPALKGPDAWLRHGLDEPISEGHLPGCEPPLANIVIARAAP
jgi:hypothetical protein